YLRVRLSLRGRPAPSYGPSGRASSARDGHLRTVGAGALVVGASILQQLPPRPDIGATAQQRSPLALRHPTPDAELDAIVEGVGKALGADGTATADDLRLVLRGSLDEE